MWPESRPGKAIKAPPQPLPTRGRDLTCGTLGGKMGGKSKPPAFSPLVGEMPAGREGLVVSPVASRFLFASFGYI
jgi:hypothetical protein